MLWSICGDLGHVSLKRPAFKFKDITVLRESKDAAGQRQLGTQRPRAFWPAIERPERLGDDGKK